MLLAVPTIKRVGIEGHTDAGGKFANNLDLSGAAPGVLRWLVSRGISPDRLEAKGYGPTPSGHQQDQRRPRQNRRVGSTSSTTRPPAREEPQQTRRPPFEKPVDKAPAVEKAAVV